MMWAGFLSSVLQRLFKQGALTAVYPDERLVRYGDASSSPFTLRLHARSLPRRLLINPDNDSLEAAQENKKALIAANLLLAPGQRVLDIGCGWGGSAPHLACEHDAEVTGVTLSREQLRVAEERARAAGIAQRISFRLQDYRQVDCKFRVKATKHFGSFRPVNSAESDR